MMEVNFNPFPQITTERLLLCRITGQHAAALLQLRSNEQTMQYIDKEKAKTIAEIDMLIKRIDDDLGTAEGITWCMALKEDPLTLIGSIGFWRIIKQHYRAEIGYMLHHDHLNKGLMTEAVKAVIDFGFNTMQLHSIEAHINPSNAASAALLTKMGFVREAYFKEDYFFRGKFLDSAIYSLLNKK
jgi:[ribosomal protein S5]-alanine N-acetyltransferase